MRFHGSIFPDSLAGLGDTAADYEAKARDAQMRGDADAARKYYDLAAQARRDALTIATREPVATPSGATQQLIAQLLPDASWVRNGLTGGLTVKGLWESVEKSLQQFPQLPQQDVARYVAKSTVDYIKAGGKTNRAIVNLKYESDGGGGVIAVPYQVTYNNGNRWKCADNQPVSDAVWDQMVRLYGNAYAKAMTSDAYCGPDKHRALKAFLIACATLVIGGVAAAAAPAVSAGAAGATGGVGAAGAAGATTATTAGASAALTAAAVPAGIEVVTVAAAPIVAGSSVAAAITAGAVVAGAAAPVIASPTVNPNPAPPQPTNPPAPSVPTSEVIETVTSTASAPAPVAANVANAITAGAVVASAAPPAIASPTVNPNPATPTSEVIETVTTTASAPAPVAANVANAITAGAVVASAAPPALTPDAPIETVTTEATRIEQMPVDQATTLATGLVSVGIQIPNIPDIPPPEPVEIESGASEPGSMLSDTVKQNIQDAIAQYGADWVKQHLVDILADSTGTYPDDGLYDDALNYVDAGAPSQASLSWWIFAGLAGGFLLMAATKKKGKGKRRVRRAKSHLRL